MPRQDTGAAAWLVGLTVLLCFPFISSLIAGVLMIGVGLTARGKGGLAAHNGVRAANWGMTYLLATIVLVGGHFLMLWYLMVNNPDAVGGLFPFGILIALWVLVSVWHVVVCIWGGVVAGRAEPFRGNGIPFFRVR